jgi:phospholipase C
MERLPSAAITKVLAAATGFLMPLAVLGQAAAGTIQDVRHVVVLMQENRAFDHYFGSMGGVRGYNDRTMLSWTNGNTVLAQPNHANAVLPFHLPAPCIDDVDHSESSGLGAWDHGLWDRWVSDKGTTTMGYFTRADMPFHYALADAYTVCDNYYSSFIGPTFPNRLYLFTGMIDPNGLFGGPVLDNSQIPTNGLAWTTYPERLQTAGISWKVYRPVDDWFGDALMWFTAFENAVPGDPLYDQGLAMVWDPIKSLAEDVSNGTLPEISWVIPTIVQSEHPSAPACAGETFIKQLLTALAGDTNVLNSTVVIINYDENGGFFDHLPPPIPPPGTPDEYVNGQPLGLGVRVPMMIISPWTRGGRVCSQVFDHTSVIRFLETWTGVQEPTISAWRRQVSGDLTSAFNFANPDFSVPALPPIPPVGNSTIVEPAVPSQQSLPLQETNTKTACPLPYQPNAACAANSLNTQLLITLTNSGTASVHFSIYRNTAPFGYPQQYDVLGGASARSFFSINSAAGGPYDFLCFGPNGFERRFTGVLSADGGQIEVSSAIDGTAGTLTLTLTNGAETNLDFTIIDGYGASGPATITVPAGGTVASVLAPANGWYDIAITNSGDASFLRLLAGHIETGAFSSADPPIIASNFPPAITLPAPPAAANNPILGGITLPVPILSPPAPIVTLATVVSNLIASNPIQPPTSPPSLLMGAYTGGVALLYPVWASNSILQYSPSLLPGSWIALNVTSSMLGNYFVITQPATNTAGFFELTH